MNIKKTVAKILAVALVFSSLPQNTFAIDLSEISFGNSAPEAVLLSPGDLSGEVPEKTEGDYSYTELEDGTVEITKYNGSELKVDIPAQIGGKSVTVIGDSAFYDNGAESITMPDTITAIYSDAFTNCDIKNIVLSNNLTVISSNAFAYCDALTEISIPDSVQSIESYAFLDCSSIKELTIPDGITSIEDQTFEGCTSLVKVKIPDSVTNIGNEAFSSCKSLVDIVIPDSVQYIGEGAFSYCRSIKELTIPDGITSIEYQTFEDCTSLVKVKIPDSVINIEYSAFENCSSLTDFTIPSSVTNIKSAAFAGCTSLKKVYIPETVETIDDYAFGYYYDFETPVRIDDFKVDFVKKSAAHIYAALNGFTDEIYFETEEIDDDSIAIAKVACVGEYVIPSEINGKKVTQISSRAFANCKYLTNVTIPDSVEYIGEEAFYNCTMLKEVSVPENVTDIGERAFGYYIDQGEGDPYYGAHLEGFKINYIKNSKAHYYAVKNNFTKETCIVTSELDDGTLMLDEAVGYEAEFVIPSEINGKKITEIGKSAFYYNIVLTDITIPEGVVSIGDMAFSGCSGLTTISLPNSVTSIGSMAFSNCSGLTSISMPDSVTSIGNMTFWDCDKLTDIKIPDKVETIGDSAFCNCTSLKTINIPNGVKSIGDNAFNGCTALADINIPASVTEIGADAFNNTAILNNQNSAAKYVDKWLIYCDTNATSVSIKADTVVIADSAFLFCSDLTSVTIPDGVTRIGDEAFRGCTSLTSVTLPDNLLAIGDYAFYNCTSLANITIPASVTYIGYVAFGYFSSEDSYTIETIDGFSINYAKNTKGHWYATDNGFSDETCIITRELDDGTVEIEDYAQSGTDYVIPATIDGKKVSKIGKYAFRDCGKLTSVIIPDGVISIDDSTFSGCFSLVSITLPDSVTSIGDSAFEDCSSLASIKLPDNLTKIGKSAFEGCKKLTGIVITDKVSVIGERAFYDCTSIANVTIPMGIISIGDDAFGYYDDYDDYEIYYVKTRIYPFYIYCYAGTAGEQYAKANWFNYEILKDEHTHEYGEWTVTKAVSCLENGERTRICSICNETDTEIIPATGHTEVIDKAVEATCTKTGLTEGIHCSVCNAIIKAQEVIPAKGHTEVIDKAVEATCTKTGLTEGKHCSVCNAIIKAQEVVPAKGHIEVIDKAVEATCTKTGLTEGKHCSVCNTVIKAQEVVPAKGHTEVVDNAVAATCTKTGLTEGKHCSVCGTVIKAQETVPATGKHNFSDWKTTKPATCTEAGTQTRTCPDCGKVETQTIAKTAHKYVNTVVKPTYTAQGYTLHKCSVCGASYKDKYTAKLTIANMSGFKAKSKSYNSITLQWNKNTSATGYELQKWDGKKWVALTKITKNSTTTYTVKSLKASSTYKYRIRAYKTIGKATQYSGYKELSVNTNPSNMGGFKAKSKSYNSITLQWNKNTSATGYELQKWDGKKWVALTKITKNSTTTYTVKNLKASTTYKYRIRAYKTIGKATQYSGYKELSVNTNPSNMGGFKAKSKSYNSITLQWNKNTSATGYELQKWDGKKWVALTKITKNSTTTYTVKSLKASTTYKYRIRAYKTIGKATQYSGYKELSVNTNPSNMSGFKAKSTAKTSVTLQWKKNTSATGYEIQKWDGKKWVSAAKVAKNSTVTSTVKNLKKNTSYKFRIRAYKTIGKTTQYSSWSGTLTVKTKK